MLRIRIRCGWRGSYCLRRFATATRDERWERVDVKCGSSGSIGVDLYNTKALANPNTPLIIYLPPTGVHLRTSHPTIPSPLLHPSTSLALINYRWNSLSSPTFTPSLNNSNPFTPSSLSNHAFPTPLHDILHAYAYLTSRFSAQSSSPSQQSSFQRSNIYAPAFPRLKPQRPIVIYGSFLSGALATSLALTESRKRGSGEGTRIAGLVIKDGIFDFSSLALIQEEDVGKERGEEMEGRGWTEKMLHGMKKQLFASPAGTFDSFASPVFFFRTSGVYVPKIWPGEKEEGEGRGKSESEWVDGFLGFDGEGEPIFSSPSTSTPPASPTIPSIEAEKGASMKEAMLTPPTTPKGNRITEMEMPPPPGKAHLKFPPSNTDLIIPPTLFLYTTSSPLSSSSSTSPPASPNIKSKPSQASTLAKRSAKSKDTTSLKQIKAELGIGGLNPYTQATEMRNLMVRSVRLYEGRESDDDPRELGESRVGIVGLGGEREGREDEKEEAVVGEWIEDLVGDGRGMRGGV